MGIIRRAIMDNDVQAVRSVCSKVNVDLENILNASANGFTPLYIACQEGNLEIVRLMIDAGAEIDLPILPDLDTPLLISVVRGNIPVFRELVQRGADINKPNKENITPFLMAIKLKHTVIIDEFLNNPALNINFHTDDTESFLIYAIRWGEVETARKLIEKGINLELPDDQGGTALYMAAQNNQLEIVRLLLRSGANPNIEDEKKYTPLHVATGHNFIPICMELLNNGAKLDAENIKGITPLDIAREMGRVELVTEYLKRSEKQKQAATSCDKAKPSGIKKKKFRVRNWD